MLDGLLLRTLFSRERKSIQPLFEDRLHALIRARTGGKRSLAGRLQSLLIVAFGEPQESQAALVTVLGMQFLF